MKSIHHDKLVRNLGLSLFCFFAAHGLVFCIIAFQFALPLKTVIPFLFILLMYHLLLMFLLSTMTDLFVNTTNNQALKRINIPLVITLARFTSIPTIISLIVLLREYQILNILIIYTVLAFVTDFLDGKISRKMKQTTKIGAYLDSIGDYVILITVSVAYIVFELLPDWFFVLVMIRLLFQWIAASCISIINKNMVPHRSSLLAKSCILLIMTIYAVALLQFLPSLTTIYPVVMQVLLWICTPVLLFSLVEKIIIFRNDLKHYLAIKKSEYRNFPTR